MGGGGHGSVESVERRLLVEINDERLAVGGVGVVRSACFCMWLATKHVSTISNHISTISNHIPTISNHIQPYPTISNHTQPYPTIFVRKRVLAN